MDESKVHIDDLFRSKEQPFVALPGAAWNDMKLRLDKSQPKSGFLNRWIWYVLLSFLVASIGFYLLRSYPKDNINNVPAFNAPVSPQKNSHTLSSEIREPVSIKHPDIRKTTQTATKISNKILKEAHVESAAQSKGATHLPQSTFDSHTGLSAPVLIGNQDENQKNDTTEAKVISGILIDKKPANHIVEMNQMHSLDNIQSPALLPVTFKGLITAPVATYKATFPYTLAKPLSFLSENQSVAIHTINEQTMSSLPMVKSKSNESYISKDATSPIIANMQPDSQDSLLSKKSKKQLPIEFGFKAGYELGTNKPSVNKLLFAPYFKYQFNSRFSLVLQPTIKYGTFVGTTSSNDENYYNRTVTTVDSQTISKNGHPFWQITYTHNYDSITVKYRPAKSTVEVEIPLILQYHLKKGIFFDAGLNLALGNLIIIEEQRQTTQMAQTAVFQIEKAGTHPAPDTSKSFHHSALPYAAYTPPEPTAISPVRIGYQLGIGFEHKKWVMEGLLEQNVYGLSGITQPDVKRAYQTPYLHFLLGYRIKKK